MMGMIASKRDTCTVTRLTGDWTGQGTPYRNCMHLIDYLTDPFPSSPFSKETCETPGSLPRSHLELGSVNGHACTTCSNQSVHCHETTIILYCLSVMCRVFDLAVLATTYENLNHRLSNTDPISRIHPHMHVPNIVCPRHAPKLDSIPMLLVIPPADLQIRV